MAGRVRVVVSAFAAGIVLLAACTSGPAGPSPSPRPAGASPSPRSSPTRSASAGSVTQVTPRRLPPDASSVSVGHRLFVATESGVTAYRLPCPESGCRALGRLEVPDPLIAGYPRPGHAQPANTFRIGLVGRTLFVVAEVYLGEGSGIFAGRVLAFDPGCALPCRPMWWTPPGRGLELPAVHGRWTYVGASTGLAAYERCPRDGAVCRPAWTAPMNTRSGLMRMHTPVVHGRYVLALTTGCTCGGDGDAPMLAAFPSRCEGTCRPLWSARLPGGFAEGPAVCGGSVYASGGGGVLRFPLSCFGTCRPTARFLYPAPAFPRTPVPIGGYLLAPTNSPNRVLAFEATCSGRCEPVATWRAPGPLRTAVEAEGSLLVLSGRSVSLLPPPRSGRGWGPSMTRDLPRVAETVTLEDGVALVGGDGWTRALRLP